MCRQAQRACLPAGLPTGLPAGWLACLPASRPACLPSGLHTVWLVDLLYFLKFVRCRHAGQHSHTLCISSGTGMQACRSWDLFPLYLVPRRHAGMPDVGAMPSVYCPVPACWHAGAGRDKESMTPTSGIPA